MAEKDPPFGRFVIFQTSPKTFLSSILSIVLQQTQIDIEIALSLWYNTIYILKSFSYTNQ